MASKHLFVVITTTTTTVSTVTVIHGYIKQLRELRFSDYETSALAALKYGYFREKTNKESNSTTVCRHLPSGYGGAKSGHGRLVASFPVRSLTAELARSRRLEEAPGGSHERSVTVSKI